MLSAITPSVLLTSAVFAALLTGTFNIILARRKSREEECSRVRTAFAEAFSSYAAYKEYPYVIRRRNADKPGEERVRISEQLRQIQERISYFLAWTQAESEPVGQAYAALIRQVKSSAGIAMTEAWQANAITEDADMVIPTSLVDLGDLRSHETAYFEAVKKHLNKLSSSGRK